MGSMDHSNITRLVLNKQLYMPSSYYSNTYQLDVIDLDLNKMGM